MNLSALNDFLCQEKPRFLCTAEPGEAGAESYTAIIEHRATGPGNEELPARAGALDQLMAFYSEFSSLRLYCDTRSSSSAFYLAKPSEWEQLKQELLSWIMMLGRTESRSIPDWTNSAVVFGEIPETGNYLMIPSTGANAGKIFLFDHETCDFEEEAPDLATYLRIITTPNGELLKKIRANTRFSDGETATQWLAQEYLTGS